jgi:hypothetical protein
MKKSIVTIYIALVTPTIFLGSTPGCTRKNSDGIIRDLLFMHIDNGQLPFAMSLLDTETMSLTDLSGNSVTNRLNAMKSKYDIGPILKHLSALEQKKALSEQMEKIAQKKDRNHPNADPPD